MSDEKKIPCATFLIACILCAGFPRVSYAHIDFERLRPRRVLPHMLEENIRARDIDSILQAGEGKYKLPVLAEVARSPVPSEEYIKLHTEDPRLAVDARMESTRRFADASFAAKAALARMGDEAYFSEFIVLLSTSNKMLKSDAIRALGYIRNKRSVCNLGPLLYQDDGPAGSSGTMHSAIGYAKFSELAMSALERILPEIAKKLKKDSKRKMVAGLEWKAWWEKTKSSCPDQ